MRAPLLQTRDQVLGPISLEVSAKTPRDQQVVEACVAVWIWNSFVCQSKADYDQLYKYTNSARGASKPASTSRATNSRVVL